MNEYKHIQTFLQGKIVYDEEEMSYYEGEWKDHVRCGHGYRRYR